VDLAAAEADGARGAGGEPASRTVDSREREQDGPAGRNPAGGAGDVGAEDAFTCGTSKRTGASRPGGATSPRAFGEAADDVDAARAGSAESVRSEATESDGRALCRTCADADPGGVAGGAVANAGSRERAEQADQGVRQGGGRVDRSALHGGRGADAGTRGRQDHSVDVPVDDRQARSVRQESAGRGLPGTDARNAAIGRKESRDADNESGGPIAEAAPGAMLPVHPEPPHRGQRAAGVGLEESGGRNARTPASGRGDGAQAGGVAAPALDKRRGL